MSEIVIRVDSRMIERIIYWVIIVALVATCVFLYLDDGTGTSHTVSGSEDSNTLTGAATNDSGDTDATATANDDGDAATGDDGFKPLDTTPNVDETCSDDIKNQDETHTDCGGICTDVNGEYWYGSECHKDPEPEESDLSGTISFSLDNVEKQKSPTSDFYKVKSVRITVENGKSKKLIDPYVKVWVKSTSGIYLNQFTDDYEPYYTSELASIESGGKVTKTLDIGGSYIFSQTGYAEGDDFKVTVELYDSDDNKIESATKTVNI